MLMRWKAVVITTIAEGEIPSLSRAKRVSYQFAQEGGVVIE